MKMGNDELVQYAVMNMLSYESYAAIARQNEAPVLPLSVFSAHCSLLESKQLDEGCTRESVLQYVEGIPKPLKEALGSLSSDHKNLRDAPPGSKPTEVGIYVVTESGSPSYQGWNGEFFTKFSANFRDARCHLDSENKSAYQSLPWKGK